MSQQFYYEEISAKSEQTVWFRSPARFLGVSVVDGGIRLQYGGYPQVDDIESMWEKRLIFRVKEGGVFPYTAYFIGFVDGFAYFWNYLPSPESVFFTSNPNDK